MTSPSHAAQHANVNDAVEAVEATLGVNPQGAYADVAARLAALAGSTPRQEAVATQNITGADVALADLLNFAPVSAAGVLLILNGVVQRQGVGFDYTIAGQTITWLAATGTAVDMTTADVLVAFYLS
jgi:hypothetical protein